MTNNISRIWRRAPIVAILVVAVLGAVFLRPYLSFAMLAENRQILIDLVAGHWALSVAAFIALYIVVVAFSLPGATVMTLTGGFLFGLFPGVLFNIAGASIGAVLIFLAVRMGFGEALAARIDAG
ncbi:MAG: TVP38/TMEM64 family protein, partial [Maritimibacter sp.]